MEATGSSESSATIYQTTQRHSGNLYRRDRENVTKKSTEWQSVFKTDTPLKFSRWSCAFCIPLSPSPWGIRLLLSNPVSCTEGVLTVVRIEWVLDIMHSPTAITRLPWVIIGYMLHISCCRVVQTNRCFQLIIFYYETVLTSTCFTIKNRFTYSLFRSVKVPHVRGISLWGMMFGQNTAYTSAYPHVLMLQI
jgi:hypothetical protein